jgi:hypothetical protein
MATTLAQIEAKTRLRLIEITPRFWTSAELIDIIAAGCRDLWRDVVDLKAEHYLEINDTGVSLAASGVELSGVPANLHKVYLIEPRDTTTSSTNPGISFEPLDYNHVDFRAARSRAATDASNVCIYYAIIGQGAPVGAPRIMVAPKVSSVLNVTLTYVPTLGVLTAESNVPIPGEADNALVAWTVAFARAKESEDRSPDANWLSIYATEKSHLLGSLGLRQTQEPEFAEAMFSEYWG